MAANGPARTGGGDSSSFLNQAFNQTNRVIDEIMEEAGIAGGQNGLDLRKQYEEEYQKAEGAERFDASTAAPPSWMVAENLYGTATAAPVTAQPQHRVAATESADVEPTAVRQTPVQMREREQGETLLESVPASAAQAVDASMQANPAQAAAYGPAAQPELAPSVTLDELDEAAGISAGMAENEAAENAAAEDANALADAGAPARVPRSRRRGLNPAMANGAWAGDTVREEAPESAAESAAESEEAPGERPEAPQEAVPDEGEQQAEAAADRAEDSADRQQQAPARQPGEDSGNAARWFTYQVPRARTKREREMTPDERIRQAVADQAAAVDMGELFPNARDFSEDLGYTSPEDFARDYAEGNIDTGRYEAMPFEAQRRMLESVDRIVSYYMASYIPLESQSIDDQGNIRFEPATETAINNFMAFMGLRPHERYLVFQMATKALGFSPDRNGLYLGKDNAKVPDAIFRQALANMTESCLHPSYGHPYGFVNKSMMLGGTRCYPVGVMTVHEAQILCREGGRFEGQDPMTLVNAVAKTWVNQTLPDIRHDIYQQDHGYDQMVVLEDMVRAIASLDSITPRKYGVSEVVDRGYEAFLAEQELKLNKDGTDEEVKAEIENRLSLAKDRRDRAYSRLDTRRNRLKRYYDEDVVDGSGNIIHRKGDRVRIGDWYPQDTRIRESRNSKASLFDSACRATANFARFNGVVGYVPIMGSAIVEHAQGNLNTIVANRVLFGGSREYRPTEAMYRMVTSDEGLEAIAAMKAIMSAGGMDALMIYYENYKVLNRENAGKFLRDFVEREHSDAKMLRLANKISSRMNEATRWLMPGDLGFAKSDAMRWLDGFMIGNKFNAERDDQHRFESYTADEVMEMMEADGMARFMAAATSMQAGRDALVMMRNQTLDRQSPLSHKVDQILKRFGVTDAIVTLGIDTYFTYGMNLIQNFIPFSNTFSFLATRGINYAMTGGVANRDELDIESLDYQLGGLDQFGAGLYKNFVYDAVKLGNIVGIMAFFTALIAALGFEEPEDPSLKYAWNEYRIGKNLALGGFDENGEPHGIPVYAAWWLNDLTLFGLPGAYAIHAANIDQTLGDNDPMLGWKLFHQGCVDMLSGAGLFDMIHAFTRTKDDLDVYAQMMEDKAVEPPADWFSMGLMQAELFAAHGFGKFMPNAAKSILQGDLASITGERRYDRSAYKVYDRNDSEPGKTQNVDDWFELQRRIESRYNPLYALWNNITKNHYLADNGMTMNTGYFLWEMPLATAADDLYMTYSERYDLDGTDADGNEIPFDKMSAEEQATRRAEVSERIISDFEDEFGGNAATAVANGFHINWKARVQLADYCNRQLNFAENEYNYLVYELGLTGADKNNAYTRLSNARSYWKGIRDNLVFNPSIPWNDDGYVKLKTNSQIVYQYNDSGAPATYWEWAADPDSISKKYIPRGDFPNQIAPFTTPAIDDRTGYNYEHISKWMNEDLTDTDRIFERGTDENGNPVLVPYGRDEGVPINTAIFGGSPDFRTTEPIVSDTYGARDVSTMGRRGYVDWDDAILKELPNVPLASYGGAAASGGTAGASGASNTGGAGSAVSGAVDSVLGAATGAIGAGSSAVPNSGQSTESEPVNPLGYDYVFDTLKGISRVDTAKDPLFGEWGTYIPKEEWEKNSTKPYSGGGYRKSGGSYSRSSSNYNPRIYNTRVSNTHVGSTHISSTRVNPDSQDVQSDRASSMYSKSPNSAKISSYLRPEFSTKGSRESYKRQDI